MPAPRPWIDAVDATDGGTVLMSSSRNDDQEESTVQASAFKAEETGECSDVSGEEELAWQVDDMARICHSGASTHVSSSADCVINYREFDLNLRIADGSTPSIKGYGGINVVFRSRNGLVQVLITNVAHVPDLRHHRFSLPALVKNGHTSKWRSTGVAIRLESERAVVFPLSGTLHSTYDYRVDRRCRENACAVLAPGQLPNKSALNINNFHHAAGYFHEVLFRKTVEQQGIALEEELRKCRRWRR